VTDGFRYPAGAEPPTSVSGVRMDAVDADPVRKQDFRPRISGQLLDKRREKAVDEEESSEPFDVLEVLDSLPRDHAEKLRQEKISELREELSRYEKR
jgi:hypothetical protein